jgi:imidazolonepropionase-like amidohydrolase
MPDDTLVIRAARLIDGTARPPLDRPVVLVRNGRVVSVAQDEAGLPPDARRLDFPDATLLPGLVDVHVHLNLPGDGTPPEDSMQESDAMLLLRSLRNAQLDLRAGATTVQDTGARNRTTLDLRDAIEAGV